jgi:chromosome segregation and condensation protein ScpB
MSEDETFELTEDERRMARIHATAYEDLFNQLINQQHRRDVDQTAMRTLATSALSLGGAYRKIANSGRADT